MSVRLITYKMLELCGFSNGLFIQPITAAVRNVSQRNGSAAALRHKFSSVQMRVANITT